MIALAPADTRPISTAPAASRAVGQTTRSPTLLYSARQSFGGLTAPKEPRALDSAGAQVAMSIHLSSLLPISDTRDYKVHLACWNGEIQPLNVFVRDRKEWDSWNSWRSAKDEFNRTYILSLIDFYPEPGIWLFGGIYKVLDRSLSNQSHSYTVDLVLDHEDLVGRLKVRFARPGRIRSIKLENYYSQMTVSELLREPYTGEPFPGYEGINHDFGALEAVFKTHRPDWRNALEHIKGVYLIADKSNGKKYVGSAYGESGVWARWSSYIETGHGGNDELTQLISREGLDYARRNFRISLLEYRPAKTDDKVIIERESYWKEALLSRGPFGYNKN